MNETTEPKQYSNIILFLGIVLLIGLGIANVRQLQKINQLKKNVHEISNEKKELIQSIAVRESKLQPLVDQLTLINKKIETSKHTSDSLLDLRNQIIANGKKRIEQLEEANAFGILSYLNATDTSSYYYSIINGDSVFVADMHAAKKIALDRENLQNSLQQINAFLEELSQKDSTIFDLEAAVFNLQTQKSITDSICTDKIALLTIEKNEFATILRQTNRRQKIKTGIFSGTLAILAGTIFYTWIK